jgi:hypothetical protein
MRYLLLAVSLCFGITGCYTMLYPPVNELISGYGADGSVLTVSDSASGTNITIVNQNQIIFDRYYQDPFYQRGGFYGGSGYWDSYYYNPGGYHQDYRWHHEENHQGYTPGTDAPKPKTPRREKDYRGSEAPADNPPDQTEVANVQALTQTAPPVRSESVPPAQSEPLKTAESQPAKPVLVKEVAAKPADNERSLNAVRTPTSPETEKQTGTPQDQNQDKKLRREGIGGR